MTPADARRIVLALPGISESDHHGKPSFRDNQRILASLPSPEVMNVMVDEVEARAAVASDPKVFALVWWGGRVSAVQVRLAQVAPEELVELVELARRPTPARRTQLSTTTNLAPPPHRGSVR